MLPGLIASPAPLLHIGVITSYSIHYTKLYDAILGALFGKTTPSKIGTALSKGSRVLKERGDVSRAEERVAVVQKELELLEEEIAEKIEVLAEKYAIENCEIESFST